VKKTSHSALVVRTQLAMAEPPVEPKLGVGIFCQRLLQRLRVRKGDHGIIRRMDQENRNPGMADSLRR